MPTDSRICGLMLAYFKSDMTLKCLQTLVDQGMEQIILVDNSADAEENQRTLALAQHFPAGWLNVVIAPCNLGFAKGMNLALEQARQRGEWDYFLILNNDISAQPELLASLHGHMQTHPETALLGVMASADSGLQGGLYYQRLTGLMFRQPVAGSFQVATGHCLMIRASVIHKELFDPRYFMYGEDVALSWRMLQQQQGIHILPQPLLTHTPAQSSGEGSLFYEYHINRGHWLIVDALGKNRFEQGLMYALRLPLLVFRAALRSWRFRRLTPIKALVLASLALPIRPSTTQ